MHCNNGYVCWQTFSASSDEKIVLAAESIVGYSVVFVVFIENLILIALLASRKTIQVGRFVFMILQIQEFIQSNDNCHFPPTVRASQ